MILNCKKIKKINLIEMINQDRIIPINIENQMQTAYIDYAMSVIVSRALPDVRDGFKQMGRAHV